jgi:NAD(P)-dependent dehydrogenase (short-subunit alcohol dehydrogenase family)
MDSVVVTGASTGIGRAATKALAAKGFRVFGSVRRPADADSLVAEFGANVVPLLFDITDAAAVAAAAGVVGAALGQRTLAGLVNNAGIAVPGPLLQIPIDELRRQLEVNLVSQLAVTQAFAPLLGTDPARTGRKGRIVMVSSVGGRRAMPFNGPYSASKFALEGLSESLRRELMLFGIDVVVVAPGTIETPIWDKAEMVDLAPFAGSPYEAPLARFRQLALTMGRQGLPADRVGAIIVRALTAARPKARYGVAPNPLGILLQTMLPSRMMDRMIARRLGLRPAAPST